MKTLMTALMFATTFSALAEIDFSSEKAAGNLPKIQIVKYDCNPSKTHCQGLDQKGKLKLKIVSEEYSNQALVFDDQGKKIASIDDTSSVLSLSIQLEKVGAGLCSLEVYVSNPSQEIKKSRLDCPEVTASVAPSLDRRPGFAESYIRLKP